MNHATLTELHTWLPDRLLLAIAPVRDCYAELPPEEQALVERAIASRRHEFSSARLLAHSLLAQIGHGTQPLLRHPDRSPAWPNGVIGSLSHSRRWCAAALTHAHHELLGVGVDIEDLHPLATELFAEILTPKELAVLHKTVAPQDVATRVLACFSVKESVYKCLHPLGNTGLGFHAMELDFSADISRPVVVPLNDLQKRLPRGAIPQAYCLQQKDAILSVVTLTTPAGDCA